MNRPKQKGVGPKIEAIAEANRKEPEALLGTLAGRLYWLRTSNRCGLTGAVCGFDGFHSVLRVGPTDDSQVERHKRIAVTSIQASSVTMNR